jgi:hypothetical protein
MHHIRCGEIPSFLKKVKYRVNHKLQAGSLSATEDEINTGSLVYWAFMDAEYIKAAHIIAYDK